MLMMVNMIDEGCAELKFVNRCRSRACLGVGDV